MSNLLLSAQTCTDSCKSCSHRCLPDTRFATTCSPCAYNLSCCTSCHDDVSAGPHICSISWPFKSACACLWVCTLCVSVSLSSSLLQGNTVWKMEVPEEVLSPRSRLAASAARRLAQGVAKGVLNIGGILGGFGSYLAGELSDLELEHNCSVTHTVLVELYAACMRPHCCHAAYEHILFASCYPCRRPICYQVPVIIVRKKHAGSPFTPELSFFASPGKHSRPFITGHDHVICRRSKQCHSSRALQSSQRRLDGS